MNNAEIFLERFDKVCRKISMSKHLFKNWDSKWFEFAKWKMCFEIWKIRVFIGVLHYFERLGIDQTIQWFNGVKAENI